MILCVSRQYWIMFQIPATLPLYVIKYYSTADITHFRAFSEAFFYATSNLCTKNDSRCHDTAMGSSPRKGEKLITGEPIVKNP